MDKIYTQTVRWISHDLAKQNVKQIVFRRDFSKTLKEFTEKPTSIKVHHGLYVMEQLPLQQEYNTNTKEGYFCNITINDVAGEPDLKEVFCEKYSLYSRASKVEIQYSGFFRKPEGFYVYELEYEWRKSEEKYFSTSVEIEALKNFNNTLIQG